MFSRRAFLSTLAASGFSIAKVSAQRPRANVADPGPLPASIAALTSMRGQATPITTNERRARIDRARRLMADNALDAIVLAGGTSLAYFTGIRWGTSERLFAIVLPVKGDPF